MNYIHFCCVHQKSIHPRIIDVSIQALINSSALNWCKESNVEQGRFRQSDQRWTFFQCLLLVAVKFFWFRRWRSKKKSFRSHNSKSYYNSNKKDRNFFVPILLRGEELYTQMGFFSFREFSPLDIFIVESWDWYH